MALVLGLAVALTYGTADFFGGLATKANAAFVVVAVSQAWGLVVLAAAGAALGIGDPSGADLVLGGATGAAGLAGVGLLYRALAAGAMGKVAPVTAVGAAVLPVGWGLATGERPGPVALAGVVVALVAVSVVAGGGPAGQGAAGSGSAGSGPAGAAGAGRGPLVLAAGAGGAFGVLFILLAATSDASGLAPLVAARAVSVALVVATAALTRRSLRVAPGTGATVAGAGLLDMAANVLFLLAARRGLLSLVAVLASLYPAATTVLARVVLGERLSRGQLAGIALALAGLVLIAGG